MSCLGKSFAQAKDSANQDTSEVKALRSAKATTTTGHTDTGIKVVSNNAKKADTIRKKDTTKKAVVPSPSGSQTQTPKKADSTASVSEKRTNQGHLDSSMPAASSSSASSGGNDPVIPDMQAQEKPNPLPTKMAAAAIAKGNANVDISIYLPKNMNGAFGTGSLGVVQLHPGQNKDYLFYSFLGITMLLALIKISFPKYFNQIFWFFLHPNDRKKNVSDPINGQHIIPAVLLNLFFALTGGLFLTQIFHPVWTGGNFWKNWIIFSLVLVVVYFVKYLIIKLSGWLFNSPVAAGTYNNVVFSINKIMGLFLLPITLLIAYGGPQSIRSAISTAAIVISMLLIYRYVASFLLIKGKLSVNALHFILYLCAVEIIPLLLAYKVVFNNIDQLI